ncbi:MAG: hypothetical protein IT369_23225 [Candidatus Latescibacteria bacterium]|nr:hypothetical protein [Candidatus Latescibacterota bacterium]
MLALSHYVGQTNRELSRFLLSIQHGDFSQTFPTTGAGASFDELRLAFSQVMDAFRFRLHEQEYTLVSFQNIHSELEEQELEAWQRLIRVLTHEIMNSITPITSLAATADGLLRQEPFSEEELADAQEAVGTIRRRSAGLLHFVEEYQRLTRLPAPHFQILSVREVGTRIEQLMPP